MANVELRMNVTHQKWRFFVAKYGIIALKYIALVVPLNEKKITHGVISWCLRGTKVSV